MEWNYKIRFTTLKNMFPTMYLGVRKYSAQAAADYCKKEDTYSGGVRYEGGALSKSKQGKRTDLEEAAEMIKAGASIKQVAEANPSTFIKFGKGLVDYQRTIAPAREAGKPRTVIVLWGNTGSGKSLFVASKYPDAFIPAKNNAGLLSFEEMSPDVRVLFLDEFSGEKNLAVDTLKIITDRNRCVLPGRNKSPEGNHDVVIILSNEDPRMWYVKGYNVWWQPFVRRVTVMYNCISTTEWKREIYKGVEALPHEMPTHNPCEKFNLKPDVAGFDTENIFA